MCDRARTSLVEAIEGKYKMDECDMHIKIFGLPQTTSEDSEIIVPRLLCIHDAGVSHVGDKESLVKLCKNVYEVDLDRNCINSWETVFEILELIPNCTFLNLRKNPIGSVSSIEREVLPVFPNIVKLVLNYTPMSLSDLWKVLPVFPNLQELYISLNKYGRVEIDAENFQKFTSLRSLHFRSNGVSNWQDISRLGEVFPCINNLVLLDNPLEVFPEQTEMSCNFQELKIINVSETNINSWQELEKLRFFPALTELRVQDVPLLKDYSEGVRRQLLLGYLPNINRLNGSHVSEEERLDAERASIRYYMEKREEERPESYTELVGIHGKLDPLVNVNMETKDWITVELVLEKEEEEELHSNNATPCSGETNERDPMPANSAQDVASSKQGRIDTTASAEATRAYLKNVDIFKPSEESVDIVEEDRNEPLGNVFGVQNEFMEIPKSRNSESILAKVCVHWTVIELRKFVRNKFENYFKADENKRKKSKLYLHQPGDIHSCWMNYQQRSLQRYHVSEGHTIRILPY